MEKEDLNQIMRLMELTRDKKRLEKLISRIAMAFREHYDSTFEEALLELLKDWRFEVQYLAYYNLNMSYENLGELAKRELEKYKDNPRSKLIIEMGEKEFGPLPK